MSDEKMTLKSFDLFSSDGLVSLGLVRYATSVPGPRGHYRKRRQRYGQQPTRILSMLCTDTNVRYDIEI